MAGVVPPLPTVPSPPPVEKTSFPTVLHYLVVYPTLLVALGGSVPTIIQQIKAWKLETTANKVQIAEEQHRLWEKNIACLTERGVWEVDGPDGLLIKVSLCKTGDVLVRYYQGDWAPQMKWIARPELANPRHEW